MKTVQRLFWGSSCPERVVATSSHFADGKFSPADLVPLPVRRHPFRDALRVLLLSSLFLTPIITHADVIFQDDFSSSAAGNPPSTTKWSRWGSTIIRNQNLHTAFGNPEQFLRLSGTNIMCAANATIPVTGIVTLQFEFYEPSDIQSPGSRFIFGFGRNDNLNTSNAGLAIALQDGSIFPTSGTSGPTEAYSLDQFYKITLIFNRNANAVTYPFNNALHTLPSGSADLWMHNGNPSASPVKIGTYTASANAPYANQFLFRVFSDSPGNTVDVDNVYIHDTMELPNWEEGSWRSALFPHYWQSPNNDSSYDFYTDAFLQDYSYAGYRIRATGFPSTSLSQTQLTVYNVTGPPYYADNTGQTDATAKIQAAIDDAGANGGGLVYLPAGTYKVSPQGSNNFALRINSSKVVLRGASESTTFIYNASNSMRSKHVIRVEGLTSAGHLYTNSSTPSTPITQDLMGPTTVIPVANPGLFSVGNWVTIRADVTDDWALEHGEIAWIGQGSTLGGFAYRRRVVAVDSNSITVDVPTRYVIKTRDNARVVRNSTNPDFGLIECGVEYLSIGMADRTGTSGWGENDYSVSNSNAWHADGSCAIMLVRVRDCWVRNVKSYHPSSNSTSAHLLSNGIVVNDSCRVTIVNCNFQRPQYGGGNGNGYMYRLSNSSEVLVNQCQASVSRHGFVVSSMRSSGNVFLRCTDSTTGRQIGGGSNPQFTGGAGNDHHMHFSHSNLIDACTADNSYFTATYRPFGGMAGHNITASHTTFWNTVGTGTSGGSVVRSEQARYGYIIGTSGSRSGIYTTPMYAQLNPEDYYEGIGQGASLSPQSLYEEQLALRKLQPPPGN